MSNASEVFLLLAILVILSFKILIYKVSKVRNRVAVRIVIENRNVSRLRFIYSLALSNNRVEHLCVSGTCDRWKLVDHTARKTRATIKHVDDNTGNAEIRIQTLVAANRVDAFLDIGKSF